MDKPNVPISLHFITIKDLEKMIKCEDNKCVIEDLIDVSVNVKPLEERNPLPINILLQKNKALKSNNSF